jgi:hypothetical protein
MRAKTEFEDGTVSYNVDPQTQNAVYGEVLRWFMKHQCFHGESIMQCDEPQLTAAETLAELAEVFQFEVEWNVKTGNQ